MTDMRETFNKDNLKEIRKELNELLNKYAKVTGLGNIELGGIRFDPNKFTVKMTVTTKEGTKPKQIISINNVKIGDRFKQKRSIYEVTKLDNPGKFKFSVKTNTGKHYKIKPEHLAEMEKL